MPFGRGDTSGCLFFFSFPGIGSLIYFFAEFLPELRNSSASQQMARNVSETVAKTIDPGREIRQLETALGMTDSFANRANLADAYVQAGRFDEAIEHYEKGATGLFADDPRVLTGLGVAWLGKGDAERAVGYLARAKEEKSGSVSQEVEMLYAQALEQSGDHEGALEEYQTLIKQQRGEEARCRAGLLLRQMGRDEQATALFREMLDGLKFMPKHYRKAQRQWIEIAQKEVGK